MRNERILHVLGLSTIIIIKKIDSIANNNISYLHIHLLFPVKETYAMKGLYPIYGGMFGLLHFGCTQTPQPALLDQDVSFTWRRGTGGYLKTAATSGRHDTPRQSATSRERGPRPGTRSDRNQYVVDVMTTIRALYNVRGFVQCVGALSWEGCNEYFV